MTKDQFLEILSNLSVWEREGERAPHKPIMLLYALAELKRGEKVLVYAEIEKPVESVLEAILPKRKINHSHYPFWYLKTVGKRNGLTIWEIHNPEQLKLRKGKIEPLKSELRKYNTSAGFTEEVLALFSQSPDVIDLAIQLLLDAQFPKSIQEEICAMLGIEDVDVSDTFVSNSSVKKQRDPKFRDKILTAYKGECAVCGYSLRVKDRLVGVEAAHIKWHQAGGPDVEPNGLCLCSTHHILFDRGAYTIDEALEIRISDRITGPLMDEVMMKFDRASIRLPQRESQSPSSEYLRWHANQVLVGEIL
jgi:putative restriction endonuclease